MKVCGLTGSIATGKSTVSGVLAEKGAEIVDMDVLAREVTQPGSAVYTMILARFPECARGENEPFDREQLAQIIFRDATQRRWLNSVTHWRIGVLMVKRLVWAWCRGVKVLVLDSPLLFETGLHRLCLLTVAVSAPDNVQLERLMKRDGISEEFARAKIAAQMSTREKCSRAQVVVDNGGSLDQTKAEVDRLWASLEKRRAPFGASRIKCALLLLTTISFVGYVFFGRR